MRFEEGCLVFREIQEEIDKYTQQIQKTERHFIFDTKNKGRANCIIIRSSP